MIVFMLYKIFKLSPFYQLSPSPFLKQDTWYMTICKHTSSFYMYTANLCETNKQSSLTGPSHIYKI